MEVLDLSAVARMGFILGHLLAFALGAVGVALGDLAIFNRTRVDAAMLETAKTAVKWSLCALWATGLAIVWIDTGFDLEVLATKPKMLAKFLVVVALSANGWLLHRVVFKRITATQADPDRAAVLPAIAGAISLASWLFAAFLGVGKAVAHVLGFTGFIALYLAVLSLALAVSLVYVRPVLAVRMRPSESVQPALAEA